MQVCQTSMVYDQAILVYTRDIVRRPPSIDAHTELKSNALYDTRHESTCDEGKNHSL